jgi:hypothetical protein
VKFNRLNGKSTLEHISQYLALLGDASNSEHSRLDCSPYSLTCTAFSWFSALPHLEKKLHEHFYREDNELGFSHLASVKKKQDESVTNYIKRFKDRRKRQIVLNGL